MEEHSNSSNRTFLSTGGVGYRAPSPRKPDIKGIIQHIRQCRDEITRNALVLQQAALEQERTEQRFEDVAKVVDILIELLKPMEAGSVVTKQWIAERDQAIVMLQAILDDAQWDETRERG